MVMMLSYQDESQVSACCRCRLITHCSPGQDVFLLQLASKAHRNMRGSDVVCPSNLNLDFCCMDLDCVTDTCVS